MVRYRAEVLFMDSDDIATTLGNFQSQIEARHYCQRHAQRVLTFGSRLPGLWKAQGSEHWYRINRIENKR